MAEQENYISAVWERLTGRSGVSSGDAPAGLRRILAAWSARGRHYHNLSHLAALLRWADQLEDQMQDSDAVRWAIFYHDAVYRSRRKDNEEKSAQMARREMQPMGLPEALILKVEDMILRTQHHHGEGADPDTRLMLDMDLSILGAEPARYLDYAAAVRKEYRWVPAPLYRKGRSEVLRSFLKRDRIYFSDYFHQRLEAPARENLQEELSRLS